MDKDVEPALSLSVAMEKAGRAMLNGFIEGFARMKPVIDEMVEIFSRLDNDPEFAKRMEKKRRHRIRYYRMMERMKNKKRR